MSRLLRPAVLILAWGALTAGAMVFVLGPGWFGGPINAVVAREVPAGDQEVVWLNAATNAVGWERFVAAIRRLESDPNLGLVIHDDSNAFPAQTTAVPELAVGTRGNKGLIWFRWYKLTGDIDTQHWVDALMRRNPPPLAILGGGSSDRARDLAIDLEAWRRKSDHVPLLILTTATADHVRIDGESRDLMRTYLGRSFRFCFTNRQMAEAVTDFVWSHDEIRPDAIPIYGVRWADDPYSEDLFNCFQEVIDQKNLIQPLVVQEQARVAGQEWAWLAGRAMLGGIPPGWDVAGFRQIDPPAPRLEAGRINFSEGDPSQPSYHDAVAAEQLMDAYLRHPFQRRPLLIMPANPPSGHRFLRALVRIAPVEAGRFVVASGDAIDFSTIYRDRRLSWPIQDLPVSLLIFCHRDPVDPGAFQPDQQSIRYQIPDPAGKTSTSTQDLLLYQDVVETIVAAAYDGGTLRSDAEPLAAAMREQHWKDGRPRFDGDGNQIGGSGEYVVWLEPVRHGDRVKPEAIFQIWNRVSDSRYPRAWELQRDMLVEYFHPPTPKGE